MITITIARPDKEPADRGRRVAPFEPVCICTWLHYLLDTVDTLRDPCTHRLYPTCMFEFTETALGNTVLEKLTTLFLVCGCAGALLT